MNKDYECPICGTLYDKDDTDNWAKTKALYLLNKHGWSLRDAAKVVGVHHQTVKNRIDRYKKLTERK